MSTSGERIKELRKALGLSADDLASRIGKDRATIFRYEKGEIENMPLSVINNLADALHVSPGYLMGWENKAASSSNRFRTAIREEIESVGRDNVDFAVENGLDIGFLDHLVECVGPVTLDDACKAADELGTTVGELLGEESQPITTDGPASEFVKLFNLLSLENQRAILAAMQSFLSSQEFSPDNQG